MAVMKVRVIFLTSLGIALKPLFMMMTLSAEYKLVKQIHLPAEQQARVTKIAGYVASQTCCVWLCESPDGLCYHSESQVHYAAMRTLYEAPVKHHKNLRLME